ncbi:unnamed protein product [Rhodiola kirilowii]
MTVQAQYPSNVFTLNRNLQESNKATNFPIQNQTGEACLDQIQSSPMMIFSTNGNDNVHKNSNCRNQLKRGRDASSGLTTAPVDSFFGFLPQQQQQPPRTVDISQLHNTSNMNNLHPPTQKNLISSTGLKLSFPDQHQRQQMNPDLNHSLFFSDYINHQMKEQQAEIDQLLHFQGEQLKRVLSDKRQRQYRAILTATEELVVRQLGEKQAEFQKAVRRNAELEARAVQLSMEAQVWQAKARAQESAAESLQSQLQQALISGGRRDADGMEEGQADDAESVHIDPDRVAMADTQNLGPVCKACRRRPASVVLLPCRHLCICAECDGAVAACPYCFTMKNSSVEVFLS